MATEAFVNDVQELRERLAYIRQLCLAYRYSRVQAVPIGLLYEVLDGERPEAFRQHTTSVIR